MIDFYVLDSSGLVVRTGKARDIADVTILTGEQAHSGIPDNSLYAPTPVADDNRRIMLIKSAAGKKILSIAPEHKQRNLIARGLELTEKLATGAALSSIEQTESDAIKAIWARIKNIRDASNAAELAGTTVVDFETILGGL